MAFDPVTGVVDLASTIINKIWPDKSEAEKQQLAAAVALVNGQLAINQAEASSPSMFVAGWRPFIGWVCGSACAWNWLGLSVAKFVALLAFSKVLDIHPADVSEMMPVLMGMLGLGSLRTFEKLKGVA